MARKYTEEELEIKREKSLEDYCDMIAEEVEELEHRREIEERESDNRWLMRSLGIY